jgi:phosphate:Na+ symporter
MHSSAATMMIALSALHGGLIEWHSAAALVIGADLGSTSTAMLASLKGSAIKKRLAFAHCFFNLVVDSLAFVLLLPAAPLVFEWLGWRDPLYTLVAFHSAFNLLGLCLFIPLLARYTRFVERFFRDSDDRSIARHLTDGAGAVPAAAIAAIGKEIQHLCLLVLALNLRNLKIDPTAVHFDAATHQQLRDAFGASLDFERRYAQVKQLEGEILLFAKTMQQQALSSAEASALLRHLATARDLVYAAKALKDIRGNLLQLRHGNGERLPLFHEYENLVRQLYPHISQLLCSEQDAGYARDTLQQLRTANEKLHEQIHTHVYGQDYRNGIDAGTLPTLLNVNRELWHANNYLLQAVEHRYEQD